MLVISRKQNDTILIGDDIEVTVVEVRGDKVRLGINTPKEVPVHRQEVYDAIKRQTSTYPDPSAELTLQTESPLPTLVRTVSAPATLTLSNASVACLDRLRGPSELSREATLETLLEVVAHANVTSLCDLEQRLE